MTKPAETARFPLRTAVLVLTFSAAAVLAPAALLADATDDYNVALEFYKQERWDVAARSFREFLTRNAGDANVPNARLYLGQALVNQRKFDEARKVFRDYVAAHPDLADVALARFRVAESSYFLQDDETALKELDEYLAKHAEHELAVRARHYKGQTQLRLDDAAGAAATLTDLLGTSPEKSIADEARYGLARARESLGEQSEAAELYRQLAADAQGRFAPDAQFRLAAMFFEAQDYARAEQEFAALSERFPEHRLAPSAELNAGYACYSLNRHPDAIAHFRKAAADAEFAPTAEMWIGLSQKQQEEYEAASQTLQAAYERDPKQPLADRLLFHWADSELRAGNYPQAQTLFALLVEQFPDNERADDSLHLATEAALRGGDLDAADRLNQQFTQKFPGSGLRWLQQIVAGRMHLARGDELAATDAANPAAAEQFRLAAVQFSQVAKDSELEGTRLQAGVQLARTYDRLNDAEQVVTVLAPLVEAFQAGKGEADLADGLLLQADALVGLKRHAEAVQVAQVYLAMTDPPDPLTAWSTIALAETQQNHMDEALAALDQVAQLDRTSLTLARVSYECAEAAYANQNWASAASLFQTTVDIDEATGYHAAALSGLGYSQHESGDHAAAAKTFATLVTAHAEDRPLASNAAHMQGLSLQMSGELAAAAEAYAAGREQFTLAGRESPTEADRMAGYNAYRCAKGAARAWRDLARVQESDAAYQLAYEELKRQPVDQQGELDKLINEWALLSYESERFERSDELFTLLLSERPGSSLADDARLYLGESAFFANQLEKAEGLFEAVMAGEQADPFVRQRAHLLLLDIAAQQQRWPDLLQLAAAFDEQFPESEQRPYARYRLGEAAIETGELDRAVAELTALTQQPEQSPVAAAEWYPSVWVLLAEAHFRKKDYAQVEATVAGFRNRLPESPYLYHADEVLGRSYKNQAQMAKAREAFTRVIDSETGRRTETAAKAQFHIAETYLIEKNPEVALAEYYKVYVSYAFPEWQAPALFQAGQCDENLERWDGATKTYETLIAEFPDSEFAEKAKARLEVTRSKQSS